MAKHVWRYRDDAEAIIETVYKLCMEEKKSGIKLSLHRVGDRTASLTGVSRSTAQKIVEEKKAQDEQQQPKQCRKCHWRTLTRVLYGGPLPACTPWRRFCQPLITSEQSSNRVLVTLASQRSPSYEACLHTLWGESKSADGETRCSSQQDQIPSHGQGVERGGWHGRYETYVHTSHAVPKCWQDSTTGLKILFSKGN